jgi:cytochrome c-type biogenesis protein
MDFSNITIWLAFLAGLASFLSPCVFALVPAYIGYLGGRSVASGGNKNNRVAFTHGLAFVAGFSVIFILLGVAASAIGGILYDLRTWLTYIGGIVVIIFGIHLTGIYRIKFLEYDLRPQSTPDRNRGYIASFLMGIFFSAGWSPCVGPILGAILTISFSGGSIAEGAILLTAYSAGLAIPFLIASVEIDIIASGIRRYGKVAHYIEKATGILLIFVGILLFTGRFERMASLGSFFGTFDELEMGRLIFIIFIALVFLGLIPAYIASRKGRKFTDWWFFGAGLFPIALPMALMIKPEQIETEGTS